MRGLMWGCLGLGALMWSLLAWVLHAVAGTGSVAVFTVARWFQIDPGSVQWLAEGLGAAGWLAQLLIIVGWAIGMGALGLITWLGVNAAARAGDFSDGMSRQGGPRAPVIEATAQSRTIDGVPTPAKPSEKAE